MLSGSRSRKRCLTTLESTLQAANHSRRKQTSLRENLLTAMFATDACRKVSSLKTVEIKDRKLTNVGHWIQACPTNDDASYDGKPRVKKTTGIPRSMLQKVDKSEIDNLDESQRQNVMVTSDGEYVLAQADKKTWKKFQEQKNASERAQQQVKTGDKELQDRGLQCPIDKRMFVDPRKTPCCGKTYCFECIENALIESDLECPNCHTENVSLERLEPDEDVKDKIKEYQQEKKQGPGSTPTSVAGTPQPESDGASRPTSRDGSKSPKSTASVAGRKRTASDTVDGKADGLAVPAPAMKRQKSGDSDSGTPQPQIESKASQVNGNTSMPTTMTDMQSWMQQMQMPNMGFPQMPFMPNMPINPMMNPMMGMPVNMNMMNGMNPMMPNFNNFMPTNGMNSNLPSNNFNNANNHVDGGSNWQNPHSGRGNFNKYNKKFNNYQNKNSNSNSPAPQQQSQPPEGLSNVPKGPKAMSSGPPAGVPTGPAAANKFSNQQRHQGKEEDNAYMRQPVNPQRAMNRNRGRQGMRTAEYKEL